jgi:hypothetical protein
LLATQGLRRFSSQTTIALDQRDWRLDAATSVVKLLGLLPHLEVAIFVEVEALRRRTGLSYLVRDRASTSPQVAVQTVTQHVKILTDLLHCGLDLLKQTLLQLPRQNRQTDFRDIESIAYQLVEPLELRGLGSAARGHWCWDGLIAKLFAQYYHSGWCFDAKSHLAGLQRQDLNDGVEAGEPDFLMQTTG